MEHSHALVELGVSAIPNDVESPANVSEREDDVGCTRSDLHPGYGDEGSDQDPNRRDACRQDGGRDRGKASAHHVDRLRDILRR